MGRGAQAASEAGMLCVSTGHEGTANRQDMIGNPRNVTRMGRRAETQITLHRVWSQANGVEFVWDERIRSPPRL